MANFGFNLSETQPAESFEPLPSGEYVAVLEDSNLKETKSGSGHYLSCKFKVVDGPHMNRVLFANINIHHSNEKAQMIGRQQLSQLAHAAGVPGANDSLELHDLPVILTVKLTDDAAYGLRNEIKSYRSVSQAVGKFAPSVPSAPSKWGGATKGPAGMPSQQHRQAQQAPSAPWRKAAPEPVPAEQLLEDDIPF